MSLKNLTNFVPNTRKAILTATRRAVDKTSSKVNTQFKRVMAKETGAGSKTLKKRFKINKSGKSKYAAGVSFGTKVGLKLEFLKPKIKIVRKGKRKYNGVTIKVGSGARQLVEGAFIGVAKSGKRLVLRRTSKTRYPVEQGRYNLYDIADAQRGSLTTLAKKEYKDIFAAQLKYELSKRG